MRTNQCHSGFKFEEINIDVFSFSDDRQKTSSFKPSHLESVLAQLKKNAQKARKVAEVHYQVDILIMVNKVMLPDSP